MRAGRLLELLVLLQLRGRTTIGALAAELQVSVRTVHRDLEALSGAGVPVYTERGRGGGVRLLDGWRVGGLSSLDEAEARAVLLAGAPAVARDLGLEPGAGDRLFAALDERSEAAARALRDRLLIEPDGWFTAREETPFLMVAARAVWERRELRLAYAGASSPPTERVVRPLGLILKGGTWYLLARPRNDDDDRLYRLGRVTGADLLDHRFDHPPGFDLTRAWQRRKEAFAASIPTYHATVRVAPETESLLAWLEEGTPPLPLADDVERDGEGWAVLRLRFERPDSAARLLMRLGGDAEVLHPPELRQLMAAQAARLGALYGGSTSSLI